MAKDKIQETTRTPEVKQLQSSGGASMMPPTMQLQASPAAEVKQAAAPQEQKAPTEIGDLDNPASYTNLSPVAMDKIAEELSKRYNSTDSKVEKFKLARVLYPIFQTLQSRGLAQAMSDNPDYSDEIWKVVGGPGDPLVGSLESFPNYSKAFEWEQVIKEYDPKSWDKTVVNAAYFGNEAKGGGPRANNSGTGVETARGQIGQHYEYFDKKKDKKVSGTYSPEVKASSEWGEKNSSMVKNPDFDLTLEEMMQIVDEGRIATTIAGRKAKYDKLVKEGKPAGQEPPTMEKVKEIMQGFIGDLKVAFRIAKIDTVQAQSAYLAHAAGETLFLAMTEGQEEILEADPHKLNYKPGNNGPLDYARSSTNAELHGSTKSVDPLGVIESKDKMKEMGQEGQANIMNQTFIGRGPVQVTHDYNYTMTLMYMEELAKKADPKDADIIWNAILEIKRDPSQAANPKYAFLFSAAYMQKTGGVRAASGLKESMPKIVSGQGMDNGQHALFDWVSGGMEIGKRAADSLGQSVKEAANRKVETYNKAFEVISKHVKEASKP